MAGVEPFAMTEGAARVVNPLKREKVEPHNVTKAELDEFQRTYEGPPSPMPLDLRMSGEIRRLLGLATAYRARMRKYEAIAFLRACGVEWRP